MSANAQNTNIPANAEQTTVIADAQETERIATMETPQQPSVFPLQARPTMPQNMNQINTGAPAGPVPPRTAMPMPGGAPGAPATVRERLSNKMIGLVVGVSLACGLAAGVAGAAITNAINGHGAPAHSRIGAPYASSELEETPDFEQMPDMQQGGENGRSRSRRMPMQQQGPQDHGSDSGTADTESSDWLMELFEIA